jgi:hypothetical protein
MSTVDIVMLSLVGALVLRGVYTTVRTRWPMHYFDIGGPAADGVDPIVSRSMTRYVAFRTAPVFIVATFVVVTSVRWGRNEWLAAGLLVSWYATLVAASTMIDRRRRPSSVGDRSVAYWTASAVLVVLSSATAVVLRSSTAGLVPSPDELLASLWSAAFAAVAGVLVFRSMTSSHTSVDTQLLRSYREIDPRLIEHALSLSGQHNASAELVICIMVVENMQRPPWFRRLERLRGRLRRGKPSTYGVMQVRSSQPLTDRESIERAIPMLADTQRGPNEDELAHALRTVPTMTAYNNNPTFLGQLTVANWMLRDYGLLPGTSLP